MKRTAGYVTLSCALLLLALTSNLRAETLVANVIMSPGAEVNPPVPPPAGATGVTTVTINITRDAAGAVTAATMNFRGSFNFPSSVSVVGFHIHEGAVNANGPIIFDLGINTGSAIFLNGGKGFIDLNVPNVNLARLPDLINNPSRWYVNIHTRDNPAGAMRGQITKFTETISATVNLSTTQEVNPPVPLPPNATGVGTFTVNPTRNFATGEITGATVRFTVSPNLPAGSVAVGLHIHEAPAGTNGGVVIDSSLSGSNSITLTNGNEPITVANPLRTTAPVDAFKRLLNNPAGFYMNLHTRVNPAGVIRGQLSSVSTPPIIQRSDTSFLATGNTDAIVQFWVSGADFDTTIWVNGQQVESQLNTVTAMHDTAIPAALRANPGILQVQARNGAGVMSAPFAIIVAGQGNVNTVAAVTVDSARFGNTVASDSIASAFGTRLASTNVNATSTPLPTSLDGTSVYVDGVAAGLFFVSAGQINYLFPSSSIGQAEVVIVARDGTVSRGTANVSLSIPGLFTRKADGTGAPAAVASTDGQNFNINMSNADGTPVPIDAGNFVALFGTGLRYSSTPATITLGGTNIVPMFAGRQGLLEGLDQANFQVPQSLAGRGDVDLVITTDGKASNIVKLRIR
jgi:uncharacterized protein (TIGR03437 family)